MRKSILFPALAFLGAGALAMLVACGSVKVPDNIKVVENFDINKYSGKWYEIARFDFKFEKDMKQVTAEYAVNEDGSLKVLNKGFNYVDQEWTEKEGKGEFVGATNKGALKVSFFGPFYSGYNVVALEDNYNYALVFGESTEYIWILSRKQSIPDRVKDKFLKMAKDAGYNLDRLVWTKQE